MATPVMSDWYQQLKTEKNVESNKENEKILLKET